MIIAEAERMLKDVVDSLVDNPIRVPAIARMCISRWRRFFNIVPRCVTCTYIVSYVPEKTKTMRCSVA